MKIVQFQKTDEELFYLTEDGKLHISLNYFKDDWMDENGKTTGGGITEVIKEINKGLETM